MQERQPYDGSVRKLVLAFDVGTSYSSVSYSILDSGEVPVIYEVQRFPGISHVGGCRKIPSVAYYDNRGVARAFGSEALLDNIVEEAEDEGWTKAEWWIPHLGPKTMMFSDVNGRDLSPLPPNRTAIKILGDFLGYLFRCAETYIKETHAGGSSMWASFGGNIDFVLCYPNGWEGPQQAQIRRAAVLAGLVPDSPEGQARVRLVTEGEASLHFCLSSKEIAGSFKENQGVMIINSGDSPISVSSYYMTTFPSACQEIAPTECRMEGAAFVTRRAQDFFTVKLAGSKFGTPDDIAHIVRVFDETTRHEFNNANNSYYVPFGGTRDRDPAFNIRSGRLKIMGADVATFFEPSVRAIIAAVDNQRRVATKNISSIFLVGSFGANDWLFSKLQEHIKSLRLNFCRPDGHTGNAVSNGAMAFYLDHRVWARVSRFTSGTSRAVELNGELEDLRRQLDNNDVELRSLRNALQHKEESSKREAEENRKLREKNDQLEVSYRKAVDESTTLSRLLKREREDKGDILQSLHRGEAEKARALSQNQQSTRVLDGLRNQLESNDAELTDFRRVLQHQEESLKTAAEENLKLKEEIVQLGESRRKAVDESTSLSQLLKREQEDKAETLRCLRQWEDEKAEAILQNDKLAGVLDGLRHQLESKDTELENLRNELRLEQSKYETSLKGAEEENLKLKEQLSQFGVSHQRAVDESTALSQSLRQASEEMRTMQQSLDREREEKDIALSQSQRPTKGLGDLRKQVESKEVELKKIQKKLQHSQMERDKLSALLEACSHDSMGAQVHFIEPDPLSGVEVIALINALNVEISKTSTLVYDSFKFACQSERTGEINEASARTSEYTGATLACLLSTVSHADDPLLVQIAMQGVTVEFSRCIIMSWDLDSLQVNRSLATLYNSICETETQAVGGRWRALTHAHAQKVALQGVHATIAAPLSDVLVSILVAAGCTKSYKEIHQVLTQNCGERISNIVTMALQLNKALGEEVTSVDLESVSVTSGERFDEATMTNFDSYGKNLEGQIVLCTSALGLRKSEKVMQGDTVELEVTTLLKPKVVLESIVNDLDMDEVLL